MQFIVGLKKPQSTFVKLNGVGSKAGATICVVTNSKAYRTIVGKIYTYCAFISEGYTEI